METIRERRIYEARDGQYYMVNRIEIDLLGVCISLMELRSGRNVRAREPKIYTDGSIDFKEIRESKIGGKTE